MILEDRGYKVRIEKDSVSTSGNRLTTFVLRYPRFIHSELMTHRQFSRSSSSSRAIPSSALRKRVWDDPVMPVYVGKNQRGMQAKEELEKWKQFLFRRLWRGIRIPVCYASWGMEKLSVHKQLANRILEPWMWIDVIVTATEYENFFRLRSNEAAQPEIKLLSDMMQELYRKNEPKVLQTGEWHLPFVTGEEFMKNSIEDVKKFATARCARVSYVNHEGKVDSAKDIKLHDMLVAERHESPLEHLATPVSGSAAFANFIGWQSYRYEFEQKIGVRRA